MSAGNAAALCRPRGGAGRDVAQRGRMTRTIGAEASAADPRNALRSLRRAEALDATNVEVLHQLGIVLHDMGNADEGERYRVSGASRRATWCQNWQ